MADRQRESVITDEQRGNMTPDEQIEHLEGLVRNHARRASNQEREITRLYDRLEQANEECAYAWSQVSDARQREEIQKRTSWSTHQHPEGDGTVIVAECVFRGEHFHVENVIHFDGLTPRTATEAGELQDKEIRDASRRLSAGILASACKALGIRTEEQEVERKYFDSYGVDLVVNGEYLGRFSELEHMHEVKDLKSGKNGQIVSQQSRLVRVEVRGLRKPERSQQAQGEVAAGGGPLAGEYDTWRCDDCDEKSCNAVWQQCDCLDGVTEDGDRCEDCCGVGGGHVCDRDTPHAPAAVPEVDLTEVIAWANEISRVRYTDAQASNKACLVSEAILDALSGEYGGTNDNEAVPEEWRQAMQRVLDWFDLCNEEGDFVCPREEYARIKQLLAAPAPTDKPDPQRCPHHEKGDSNQ